MSPLFGVRKPKRSRTDILADMERIHNEYRCLEEIERGNPQRSSGSSMERHTDKEPSACACKTERHGNKLPLSKKDIAARKAALKRQHQKLQSEYSHSLKPRTVRGEAATLTAAPM